MSYRITGLSPESFRPLFGLSDDELRRRGARRYVVDRKGAFPDRIEVRDAEPGETVLLVNHTHQPAENPYRASHAIFVREGADAAYDAIDEIPEVMRRRLLSLRAFDRDDLMLDADVVDGAEADRLIERLFANPETAYIHAHYAKRGCFAARIDRVTVS
ncbi:MAG TPA: DUF1203 domain-containing protein [Thermoanaerobaculia bacterium]|jgi:hypothetical protein